jgi:hypothetical protein
MGSAQKNQCVLKWQTAASKLTEMAQLYRKEKNYTEDIHQTWSEWYVLVTLNTRKRLADSCYTALQCPVWHYQLWLHCSQYPITEV